jgi:hypothetical protein
MSLILKNTHDFVDENQHNGRWRNAVIVDQERRTVKKFENQSKLKIDLLEQAWFEVQCVIINKSEDKKAVST